MSKQLFRTFFLTILISVWLLLTIGIICWWWFYSMKLASLNSALPHVHRMFLWEGSFLLATTILSGMTLIIFSYRDQLRHHQLKIFFSNFSHDIKTSISRLRLQSDLIQENYQQSERTRSDYPELYSLLENIARLDLQLENSLYIANLKESQFHLQNLKLSQLLESLRAEWQEVQFVFHDIEFRADYRALLSVLRNIFSNCILHGKATEIRLMGRISNENSDFVEIEITSDGEKFNGNLEDLGRAPLTSRTNPSQKILPAQPTNGSQRSSMNQQSNSNGLGLYLSSELIKRMGGGRTTFNRTSEGRLRITLTLPRIPQFPENPR